MKKLLPLFLLIVVTCFGSKQSFASHNRGADLTYINVSPNVYLVELSYYRNCGSISASQSQTVQYEAYGCNPGGSLTVNLLNSKAANPYCASVSTACSGSSGAINHMIHTYSGTLTLNANCYNWHLSTRMTDRGNPVNLSSSNFIYIDAMLDNLNAPANTSPLLTTEPVFFIYPKGLLNNKNYTYNMGAIELDGDSLAYSLQPALHDFNVPAVYSTGYSATNPFGTNNGSITIDAVTGTMNFGVANFNSGVPNAGSNSYVVAVQVEEFRKDSAGVFQKIGHVRRDVLLQVLNGTNNQLPTLQPITVNGSAENYNSVIEIEAGQQTAIQLSGLDADLSDQLTLATNASSYFQNASFANTGSPSNPRGTLTITPLQSQVRDYPYYITFTVRDNACPLTGFETKTIGLRVKASTKSGVKEDLAKKYQLPTLLNTQLNDRLQLHPELNGATVNIYSHTGSLVKSLKNYDNNWSANSLAAGLYIYSVEHRGINQPITSKLVVVK